MVMEAANSTKSVMKGTVEGLRVMVGGIEFVLSAQVISDAPFKLLLGHPFLVLASAITRDFEHGG